MCVCVCVRLKGSGLIGHTLGTLLVSSAGVGLIRVNRTHTLGTLRLANVSGTFSRVSQDSHFTNSHRLTRSYDVLQPLVTRSLVVRC